MGGAAWAGDGWIDLYVANYGAPNALYRNNGAGGFTKVTDAGEVVTDSVHSMSAAWADYDGAFGAVPLPRTRAACGWCVGAR